MRRERTSRNAIHALPVLLAVFALLPLSATAQGDDLLAEKAASLEDLSAAFDRERQPFLCVTPPGRDPMIQPSGGNPIPFDASSFPESFAKGLIGFEVETVVMYPVMVVEDPATRDRVFYNFDGEEIGSVKPPDGYDPEALAKESGSAGLEPEEDHPYPLGAADPARIEVILDLLPADQAEKWYELFALPPEEKTEEEDGEMESGWWEATSLSNLQVVAIVALPGTVALTIGYPDDFTNKIEVYQLDSGPSPIAQLAGTNSWWDLAATNLLPGATNALCWTNAGVGTNILARFYIAGNGDVDSDVDGLSDGREVYVHHTSTTSEDTDNDGRDDYDEALIWHTDPNDADTTNPIAWITFPTNGYRSVWFP